MLRLTSKVVIGSFLFNSVEVEINSTWEERTDTCIITFPRKANWKGRSIAEGENALIRKGQKVSVSLGYDNNNEECFQGYVTKITPGERVTVHCEDEMYTLKKTTTSGSYRNVTLKQLLQDILPVHIPFESPAIALGPLRFRETPVASILAQLRERFFLHSYFKSGKLYVGLVATPALQKTHLIQFNKHIVSNSLDYVREEDQAFNLTMVSILNGQQIKYETGDPNGAKRTLYYQGKTLSELKAIADTEIQRLAYTGYQGDFVMFGAPLVRHGDIARLRSPEYPERDGSYMIKGVTYTFGNAGFRQTVKPETKV